MIRFHPKLYDNFFTITHGLDDSLLSIIVNCTISITMLFFPLQHVLIIMGHTVHYLPINIVHINIL